MGTKKYIAFKEDTMSKTNPSGTGSFSLNRKASTTIGTNSVAMGNNITASGNHSTAMGYFGTASGDCSVTMGYNNTASGNYSIAMGAYNTASGSTATVMGDGNKALTGQVAMGHYNSTSTAAEGGGGTKGTAFVIGNGEAQTFPSNACRITYAGAVIGKSSYSTSGADYAEFREWADGNPDNEDRRGYFVTLIDDKIQIASPGDYIEGIISGHPAVIGNFDECWSGQFLKDEWGEYILEDIEAEDHKTGEKSTSKWYKQNPDYDPEMKYIPREERPEWSPVGMLGHLSVRDDGTCEPNGYCKVAEGGIATASDTGYRVVKRISDNIVEIVFSIYAQF